MWQNSVVPTPHAETTPMGNARRPFEIPEWSPQINTVRRRLFPASPERVSDTDSGPIHAEGHSSPLWSNSDSCWSNGDNDMQYMATIVDLRTDSAANPSSTSRWSDN